MRPSIPMQDENNQASKQPIKRSGILVSKVTHSSGYESRLVDLLGGCAFAWLVTAWLVTFLLVLLIAVLA